MGARGVAGHGRVGVAGSPAVLRLLLLGVIGAASPVAASAQASLEGPTHVESEQAAFRIEVVTSAVEMPYAMDFLPDGRMLVTDRTRGVISLLDPSTGREQPVEGLPGVYDPEGSDAGLRDALVHPDYEENGWLYFDYAHETPDGLTLAVSRARLQGHALVDHERLLVIDRPVPDNTSHLGSRLAIRDGYLFVTMGERYDLRDEAQDNSNHHGTVLRLHDDGRVPADNPFVGVPGVRPEIWSYGHRNAQGLAFHQGTGALWSNEHGPQGGDEVNVIRPGRNYGWPVVTYGAEYDDEGGGPIGEGLTERAGMEQPSFYWVPSIGPSDMLFYQGDAFPEWRGDLFTGGMAIRHLNRLELDGERVQHEERILGDRDWRVRSLAEGPDGSLYVGVDGGMILRLSPLAP